MESLFDFLNFFVINSLFVKKGHKKNLSKNPPFNFNDHVSPSSVFFILFIIFLFFIYSHNLTRDIFGGDVGDLVSAAYLFGVAHPPGYPLFTSLGFIASHLPFFASPVTKVAYISVISSLLSVVFLKKTLDLLLKNQIVKFISIAILSFSYLFWLYSEIPEVFALNAMFVLLITFLCVRFYRTEGYYNFLAIFFFFGLGLTHHQTIILLTPFISAIFLKRYKTIFGFGKRLFYAPIFFILGLTPYIYIPVAASRNPPINWDNASTLKGFIDLVIRRDYGTFSAGPFPQPAFDARLVAVKEFFTSLISSVSFPAFILGLIGMARLFKKDRFLGTAIFLSFFLSGPFFAAYANFPIINTFVLGAVERFYLFSHVIFIIFFAAGLEGLALFLKRVFSKPEYATLIICVFFIIPLLLFRANLKKTDLSKVSMGTDFAYDNLVNVDKNALVITYGDTKGFNSWYAHLVLRYRPDVQMIQIGNFGIKNEYFDTIYLEIYKNNKNIESVELFAQAVKRVHKDRKVYSMIPVRKVEKGYLWLPRGLVFELRQDSDIPGLNEYKKMLESDWSKINVPVRDGLSIADRSLTISDIPTYYADALTTNGLFLFTKYHDTDYSLNFFNKAIRTDPQFSKGYAARSQIYNDKLECSKAEEDIVKAVNLAPTEIQYYILWYLYEGECLKNENKKNFVASQFKKMFNSDIREAAKKFIK